MNRPSLTFILPLALAALVCAAPAQDLYDGYRVTGDGLQQGEEIEPMSLAVVVEDDGRITLVGSDVRGSLKSVGPHTVIDLVRKNGPTMHSELVSRSGVLEGRYRWSDWQDGVWRECEFVGFRSFNVSVTIEGHGSVRGRTFDAEVTLFADRHFELDSRVMQAQGEMDEEEIVFSWEESDDVAGEAHLRWVGTDAEGTYSLEEWEDGDMAKIRLGFK